MNDVRTSAWAGASRVDLLAVDRLIDRLPRTGDSENWDMVVPCFSGLRPRTPPIAFALPSVTLPVVALVAKRISAGRSYDSMKLSRRRR